MVGRYFLSEAEMIELLTKDPDCDEQKAVSILKQVTAHGYDPPKPDRILAWMNEQAGPTREKVTIAVQHIPLFRDHDFPDAKPYWTVNEPYAARETDLFHQLHIKHLLAGHWHNGRVFEKNEITIHAAPALSWLPLGGQLGFAIHTITTNGDVHTEFVALPEPANNSAR